MIVMRNNDLDIELTEWVGTLSVVVAVLFPRSSWLGPGRFCVLSRWSLFENAWFLVTCFRHL